MKKFHYQRNHKKNNRLKNVTIPFHNHFLEIPNNHLLFKATACEALIYSEISDDEEEVQKIIELLSVIARS